MRALPILLAGLLSFGCASRSELPLQSATPGPCAPFGGVSANHKWLAGDYEVVPIAEERQKEIMQRLKPNELVEVDAAEAKALTGNATLPKVAHYYLVRIGYIGAAPPGTIPVGVSMSADVDSEGVAYVTTFRLGSWPATAEFAAVLTSPTTLKRVVSTCMSAE